MKGFVLGGELRTSPSVVQVKNPFSGKLVEEVCFAGKNDVENAIAIGSAAFSETKLLPSHARSLICRRVSEKLIENKAELGELISSESGKPIKDAFSEVDRAASTFAIASEEANRVGGRVIPLDVTKAGEGRFGFYSRFPVGLVSAITPFNFPVNLVAHKLAPSIAVGNPFVLKPASATPLSSLKLAEYILEAGWPKGGISVLPCSRDDASLLVEDNRVKLVSFTGSATVGWDIKKRAGRKKVVLELGGNAGVLVDAESDLDYAAKRCAYSAFAYSGQVCISTKRIFVVNGAWGYFLAKFLAEVKALKVGDPLEEGTVVGSMIDESNALRIAEWVEEARQNGASILLGGERNGLVYRPTVLTNVPRHLKIVSQEAFGPVVVIEKVNDFNDGLRQINDSAFGLQAGVFTKDLSNAFKAFKELDVGGVIINDAPSFRVDNMPYGGLKDSGFGREGVRFAVEDMTELKMCVINGV